MSRELTAAEAIAGGTMLLPELHERYEHLKGLTGKSGGHYDGKALALLGGIDAVKKLIEIAKGVEDEAKTDT